MIGRGPNAANINLPVSTGKRAVGWNDHEQDGDPSSLLWSDARYGNPDLGRRQTPQAISTPCGVSDGNIKELLNHGGLPVLNATNFVHGPHRLTETHAL